MRKIPPLLLLLFATTALAQQLIPISNGVLTLNLTPGVNSFKVLVNQQINSVVLLNPQPGTTITVNFTQVGGFSVNLGGIINACTVSTSASATTICQFTYDTFSNSWYGATGSGSTVTPGQNTQVIFNNNGTATGSPGFTYTTNTSVSGNVNLNGQAQLGPFNVAGAHLFNYGPLPLPGTSEDGWVAPSMGDPCGVARILPGYAGGGLLEGFPSATVAPGCGHYVNYGASGDANHSSGRVTGVTGPIKQNVVCTFSFCQAGAFHIIVHVAASTTSCTGSPTIQFFVNYSDDVGNNITEPIPLSVNGSPTLSATMDVSNNTNKGFGEWGFYNAAASNISYSATLASPCSPGTASYNYDVEVVETL